MIDMPQQPSTLNANSVLAFEASRSNDMLAGVLAGDVTHLQEIPDFLLDYVVAVEEGFDVQAWPEAGHNYWRLYLDNVAVAYIGKFDIRDLVRVQGVAHYSPSGNPAYSSEIITRERIGTRFDVLARHWVASECASVRGLPVTATGPTPSIAALRCYVATRAQRKTGQNPKK